MKKLVSLLTAVFVLASMSVFAEVQPGMIMQYEFPAGAEAAKDSGPNHIDGAFRNGCQLVQQSDGNRYVQISDKGQIDVMQDAKLGDMDKLSVQMWVKTSGKPSMENAGAMGLYLIDADGAFRLRMDCFGKLAFLVKTQEGTGNGGWYDGGASIYTENNPFPLGKWTYVVAQYDGSSQSGDGTLRLYFDGQQVGEVTSPCLKGKIVPAVPVSIGKSDDPSLVRNFDNVIISSELLTLQQIQANAQLKPLEKDSTVNMKLNFDEKVDGGYRDVSGNGNDGTGEVTAEVEGVSGKAVRLTGGQKITVQSADSIQGMDKFTISMWSRMDKQPVGGDDYLFLLKKEMAYDLHTGYYGTPVFVMATADNDWYSQTVSHPSSWILGAGRWNHTVVTYDSTKKDGVNTIVYLNGAKLMEGTFSGNLTSNNEPLNIGFSSDATMVRDIDEVEIRSDAMTPEQVKAMYLSYGQDANLLVGLDYETEEGGAYVNGNGSGINVKKTGAPAAVEGINGKGVKLTGTEGLTVTRKEGYVGMDNLTLATWVKLDKKAADNVNLIHAESSYNLLVLSDGTLRMVMGTDAPGCNWYAKTANSSIPVPIGEWAHVASVYDGTKITLYINGTPCGEIPYSGKVVHSGDWSDIRIGSSLDAAAVRTLDNTKILHRALTGQEISVLYETEKNPPAPPAAEFKVQDAVLINSLTGEPAKAVNRGVYQAKVKASNLTGQPKEIWVLAVQYDAAGNYLDSRADKITIEAGASGEFSAPQFMVYGDQTAFCKVLVWEDMEQMRPLAPVYATNK